MATSSIFANIVISKSADAARLADALEAASRVPVAANKKVRYEVVLPADIPKLFLDLPGQKGREQLRKFEIK